MLRLILGFMAWTYNPNSLISLSLLMRYLDHQKIEKKPKNKMSKRGRTAFGKEESHTQTFEQLEEVLYRNK